MTMTFATRMTENRIGRLCSKTHERREARIIRALGSKYPDSIPAKQLMLRTGFKFHSDPVRAFTLLCISVSSINQALRGTGWQAVRTNGTPDALYALSRIEGY